ncbi:DUF2336 domain-containing protein [Mesorhizobium sp. BR1-1-16]|uniref:DUF2336 domain-containing protein n=1 Tax=Mesorhizobium sp. BR1-1-16 TaxID=2876653 RepID=UPI001CCA45E9|nr:DUF2336 domain-containing protein [Mesorhizobium sp. BR1-1-16]MBZ9934972.1 DUF2336 domain-containing protein [Mesorhizobium sp. BR1-1-16]
MAMAVSNLQSRDAALLRATTELFVLEATHDPDEIRRFEELATHFLPRVSAADRAFVAERLSRSQDAPSAILRQLGKDLLEIASPILKRSPALGEFDFLTIMASTGHGHHRLIATRADLSPLVVAALRLTEDADVIARVAHYPEVMTECEALAIEDEAEADASQAVEEDIPTVEMTVADTAEPDDQGAAPEETPADQEPAPMAPISAEAREIFAAVRALASTFEAQDRERHSRISSSRSPETAEAAAAEPETSAPETRVETPGVAAQQGGAAFLNLDRTGRLALLQEIAGHPTSPHSGTSVIDADHAFRLALGRARLASLARQRQRDALVRTLAQGLRLPEAEVAALMDDPSGEALVVLLRGIGLSDDEAQHVLLFANPVIAAGIENFERLARLLAETKESVAAELIAGWRSGAPPQKPAHAPLFADLELRRSLAPAAMQPRREATVQEPPERSTFGLRGR